MDLFVMNRYWSEDSKEQPEQTNEEKLLQKLKAKVASKKKSKSFGDTSITAEPDSKKQKVDGNVVDDDKQESAKKKKKEKKKKFVAEEGTEPETATTLDQNNASQPDLKADADER